MSAPVTPMRATRNREADDVKKTRFLKHSTHIRAAKNLLNPLLQLKEVLQDEWSKVTMQEVPARIAEMPSWCRTLANSGGEAIGSSLW
jgi:hypothetical protein